MLPISRSALRPARSIRWLRSWRANRSKSIAMPAPVASAHSVTKARCGMTLSNTTEVTRPVLIIRTLLNREASKEAR